MRKAVNLFKVLALLVIPVLLVASCSNLTIPTSVEMPSKPEPTNEHVHSYKDTVISPSCTEDGYTLHECSCGDTKKDTFVGKLGHSFGEWVVTQTPTENSAGVKERTCSLCNQKETGTVPATAKEHTHSMGNWTVAKNPTESEKGLLVRNCKDEDYSETFAMPILNSVDYTEGQNSKPATCREAGIREYVFTRDEQTFAFKVTLPMTEHKLETQSKNSTCTEAGYVRNSCSVCGYTTEETTKPLGHTWDHEEATCEHAKTCTVCSTVAQTIKPHNPVANTTAATCTEPGRIIYNCQYCNIKLSEEAIPAIGHVYGEWQEYGGSYKNENCQIVQEHQRSCLICNHEEENIEVLSVEHSYVSEITKDACCNEAGIITYTCNDCSSVYTKNYENTSAHNYVSKGITEGVETLECDHCHSAKTVLSLKNETEASIAKDKLNNEIELKNASIALDESTVESLPDNVTIKADTVAKDDLELNAETNEKIGDNTIYNFGMADNENQITSFNGIVTVRVPYELKADENPDEIAIWYINEEGSVTPIKAKYSNGFAEFETNHFSYYTVIRLSGADRCALYEHDYEFKEVHGDCFHDSYTIRTCRYCGDVEKINVVSHNGHEYEICDRKEATCTEAGYKDYKCKNCDAAYKEYVLAPGHNYTLEEDSIKASCQQAGCEKYVCSVCEDRYEVTIAQQSHQFKDVVTKPTCTEAGYTLHTCKNCSLEVVDTQTNPLGHAYSDSAVLPTCTEAGYTLHTCVNCNDSYETNITAPSHTWNLEEPTCGVGQICILCGQEGLPATGEHLYSDKGVCVLCGDGCVHTFEHNTVDPTCTKEGYTLNTCTLCGIVTKTDVLPMLGHQGNILCTVCGELTVSQIVIDNLLSPRKAYGGITISIPHAVVTVMEDDDTDKATLTDIKLSLKLVNGELVGYGVASVNMETSEDTGEAKATLIFKNNTLYMKVKESYIADLDNYNSAQGMYISSYDPRDIYCVISIDEVLELAKLPSIDELKQMLAQYPEVVDDVTNVLTKVYNANQSLLKKAAIKLLDKIYVLTSTDKNYTLDLNIKYFTDLYAYVKEHRVNEIVDYIFGDNTYSSLVAFVSKLDKITIGEALDVVTEHLGLTIEEVVKLLNRYVPVDENTTFEDFINQMLGNTELNLADYLKTELFRSMNLFEFVAGLSTQFEKPIDLAQIQKTVIDTLELIKNCSLEEAINLFAEVDLDKTYAMIDIIVEEYKDDITLSFTADYFGNITDIDFCIDTTVVIDGISTSISASVNSSFNEKFEVEDDFTEFVDSIKHLDLPTLLQNSGVTLIQDEDGIKGFTTTQDRIHTSKHSDGSFTYVYEYKDTYTYYGRFDGIISYIESDCSGWYNIEYSVDNVECDYTSVMTARRYYNDILLDERTEQQGSKHGSEDKVFHFFYNTKTNKIKLDGNIESMHDYRLVEHTDPTGCCTYGYDKYVCAECGYTQTQYDYRGHAGSREYIYELVNPEGSCEDGVKVYIVCGDCGEKVYSHTTNDHFNTIEEAVLKDGSTSCEDGIIITRKCQICGEIILEHEENFHYIKERRINVKEYGFDGYLLVAKCLCGEECHINYDFAYDDQDRSETVVTIDDVEYNKTTTTYFYRENKFVIELLSHSEKNGCIVTERRVVYYGVKDDGTYLYTTEAQQSFESHEYESRESEVQNPDGTTTVTVEHRCIHCDAYNGFETRTFDSEGNLLEIIHESPEGYRDINRFVMINGYSYLSLERQERDNYWQQIEYKYENCMVYIKHTSSDSDKYYETSEERHVNITTTPSTCSQPGHFVCQCGQEGPKEPPHRHHFDYIDEIYKCTFCGLENEDHAYGPITLEDLTNSDNAYVVGLCYEINGNVEPQLSVSVIINDVAYNLQYDVNYEMAVCDYVLYTTVSIDKNEVNSLIEELILNEGIDTSEATVKVAVNVLDVNSKYKSTLVFE